MFDRHVEDVTSDNHVYDNETTHASVGNISSVKVNTRLLVGSCVSRNHQTHWQKSMKGNDYLEMQTSRYN
jgi:hypothetical protein